MRLKVDALKVLPFSTRSIYVVEQVLAHILLPFVMIILLLRSRKEPAHVKNLTHRIGLGRVQETGAVWIYAASLGETRAASPLIRRLREDGRKVLLTHQSPAGLTEGSRLFGDDVGVQQYYIPLDLFWAIRVFLTRFKPTILIVLEIEIWPAMMIETARRSLPIVMANGNLLESSLLKSGWARRHRNKLYLLFDHIFTRTEEYRSRYVRIGVAPSRITTAGELKFEQRIDPIQLTMGQKLRGQMRGVERVLMIASSVEGEEPALLQMAKRLLASDPGLRIVWAPRSPQRFQAVFDALDALQIDVVKRSALGQKMEKPLPEAKVLLGDSLGEMNVFYSMADLVFVGASLVSHGGHNIVEPLDLGRPVVMGPSTYGVDFAAAPAATAGAFESLPDEKALEARIAYLLKDKPTLARMSVAARKFTLNKTGATEKTVSGLASFLGQSR